MSLHVDTIFKNNSVIIKINGIMHVRFLLADFGSIHAWHWKDNYYIEIILKGQENLRMQYDKRELWADILSGLENIEWD